MTRPCLWAIGLGLLPTRFLLLIRIVGCQLSVRPAIRVISCLLVVRIPHYMRPTTWYHWTGTGPRPYALTPTGPCLCLSVFLCGCFPHAAFKAAGEEAQFASGFGDVKGSVFVHAPHLIGLQGKVG